MYESFYVLEALPMLWNLIHLFKCNCSICFTNESCTHVLLASMVCYPKIEIPLRYVTTHLNFAISVDTQRARAKLGKREIQRRRHERRCPARGMKCQA